MYEFFLKYYLEITKSVELVALAIGVFRFRKFKNTPIQYFILFIVYSVIVEIGGGIPVYLRPGGLLEDYGSLLKYRFFYSNYWWYGLFWTIGSVLFWSFFYQKIIRNKTYKQLLNFSTYVFVICVSVYTIMHINQFFITVLTFNKMFGSIIILMAIVLYFLNVLQSDIILTFYKSIYFYISLALFFWWIITMPLYFYQRFIYFENMELRMLINSIRLFTNIFMYGIFALSLLLCKPEKPLSI